MIRWFLDRVNRYRGFYITYFALWSRFLFVVITFGMMFLAAELDPKIDYIFRQRANEVLRGPNREIIDLEFRDDGEWLAGSSKDGKLYLWDFNDFDNLTKDQHKPIKLQLEEGFATDIIFAQNDYLISAGTNQELRVWPTASLKPGSVAAYLSHTQDLNADDPFLNSFTLEKHKSIVSQLVLSPDGRWLASADQSGNLVLWDTLLLADKAAMEDTAVTVNLQDFPLVDIEFSPTGHFLAISDVSGTVFLLEMTLINDPYEFINGRRVLQQYDKIVYDLAFDEARHGTLLSESEYLFAAGPQNTVIAFDLTDAGREPITFPFVHESTPKFLAVSRDPANLEYGSQYWLTSVDEKGIAVFWNLNRLLDGYENLAGQNYYEMQLMSDEPTGISVGLNEQKSDFDTSRHFFIAGSEDRSVRLVNMSVPADQWTSVQLRSLGGKINDVVIQDGNEYIASAARSNAVRVWDVDLVSDYENAIPWRSRFQFLVPMLLIYILVLQSAGTYVMQMYGLPSRELAIAYILNAMFGLNFESLPKALLSILFPVYPYADVENGRLVRDPDRFVYVDSIGGPGRIRIRPGNVVAFQTNRMQTNVATNLTYWVRPFERVRNIISLEDQYFEEKEIETYTRDGIKITMKDIRVRYRVAHTNALEKLNTYREKFIAAGATENRRQELATIFDKMRKENIDQFIRTHNLSPDQADLLRKALDLFEMDKILYFNRAPHEYGNVDRSALKKAINNMNWAFAIEKPLLKRIRYFINRHPLNYFISPDRVPSHSGEPNGWFRKEFRDQVIRETNRVLGAVGGKILWMDVGSFEVNRKEVEKAHFDQWQWNFRTDAEKIRSEGRALLEKARAEGRLACEAEIIRNITDALREFSTRLMSRPMTTQERHAIIFSRLASLMRKYLSRAKSDGTFPPVWAMNQSDPNNPENPSNLHKPDKS